MELLANHQRAQRSLVMVKGLERSTGHQAHSLSLRIPCWGEHRAWVSQWGQCLLYTRNLQQHSSPWSFINKSMVWKGDHNYIFLFYFPSLFFLFTYIWSLTQSLELIRKASLPWTKLITLDPFSLGNMCHTFEIVIFSQKWCTDICTSSLFYKLLMIPLSLKYYNVKFYFYFILLTIVYWLIAFIINFFNISKLYLGPSGLTRYLLFRDWSHQFPAKKSTA